MIHMLDRIKKYIHEAHDEVILWKRWDIKYKSLFYRDCAWRLYPFTHKYYFEGNPSFLHEYKNIADMQRHPLIMLRDGLVPLISFFVENYKPPENFQSIFLVPKRFENIIPKAWFPYVATYEFEYPTLKGRKPEVIYINGMGVSYTFWKKSIDEVVDNLLGKVPKGSKVEFLLPVRERSVFLLVDETKYISELLRKIYQKFDKDVVLHSSHDKILDIKFNKNSAFCDLEDSPYIIGDNYLHHVLCNENSAYIDAQKLDKNNALVYPLSLHHNVVIREIDSSENQFQDIAFRIKKNRVDTDFLNQKFHKAIKDMVVEGFIKF